MRKEDFPDIVDHASRLLRDHGGYRSRLDTLRDDPALLEIIGKWPPDGLLPAKPEEIEVSAGILKQAQIDIVKFDPDSPTSRGLQEVVEHLRAHLDAVEQHGDRPEAADTGEADAAGVIGPWPPEGRD